MPWPKWISDTASDLEDKAMSTIKDLAAKGTVTRNTMPARPSGIDVGKLAEDQARSMGRGDTMKKKKPMPAKATIGDLMQGGQ